MYASDSKFSCPGWTVGAGAGLAKAGSPWLNSANAAVAGTYSLFVQSKTASQEFTIPSPGRYRLSFDACCRSTDSCKAAEVYLAHGPSTNLLVSVPLSSVTYATYTQDFIAYGSGQYVLILSKAELTDGTKCMNYDNVSVELLEAYSGCVVDGAPARETSGGLPVYGPKTLTEGESAVLTAPAGIVFLDGGGIGEVTGWVAYKDGEESVPWRSGSGNVCDDYVQPKETVHFVWNWRYYSGALSSAGGEVRVDGGAWTNLSVTLSGEHLLEARAFPGYAFWRWTGETRGMTNRYAASVTAALTNATAMAVFVPTDTVRVPDGYRELEYVESPGGPWTDTGIYFGSGTVFRVKFNCKNFGGGSFIGIGWPTDKRYANFFGLSNTWYWDAPTATGSSRVSSSGYSKDHVYEMEAGNTYFKDLTKGTKYGSNVFKYDRMQTSMRIFRGSADYGLVYYLKFTDDGVVSADFVPAQRLSDGAYGFWERIGCNFHTNMNATGSFTGGAAYNDGEYLTVTAEPQEHMSALVPAYGTTSGWYAGRGQAFSADPLAGDDLRIAPTRWRVLTRTDVTADYAQRTNGTGGAFLYTHDGHNTKVIWTWETQYRLTAQAEGPGLVRFDADTAATCITNWSVTGDATVEVTAVPDAGKHFLYWTGDLRGASGNVYGTALTVSLTNAYARTLTAVFSDDPFPACHWTGAGDGTSFEDADNWAVGRVPGADDDVFVLSATTLSATASEAHTLKSLTVLGTQSAAVTLTFATNLTVRTDVEVGTNGTIATAVPVTVSNAVHVAAGGKLTQVAVSKDLDDPAAVKERLEWTVLGDMTIDAGGAVDVSSTGLSSMKGAWIDYKSAHGGRYDNASKPCYGSVLDPFAYGSGGHGSWDCRGGGVAKLRVTGTLTVNGSLLADGNHGGSYWGAAGGSLSVTCGMLAGGGKIRAEGGGMTSPANKCGGGGRIAVRQTVARDFTTAWLGTVTAYGTVGSGGKGTPQAGCGTVYLQSAADREGAGTIAVDNRGDGRGYTDFPMPEDGSPKKAYRQAKLSLGAGSTLVFTNDVTLFDLDVRHADAKIDLNGRTVRITSYLHRYGKDWASPTGTCVTVNGGKLVWQHEGFVLTVR